MVEATTPPEGPVAEHVAVDMPAESSTPGQRRADTPKGIAIADDYDRELVQRAVQDAGRWAYGIMVVELWVMNDERTKLFRPQAGHWIDPARHLSTCTGHCPLCRLTDPTHPTFLAPDPLAPGVGLPGILWNESASANLSRQRAKLMGGAMMADPMATNKRVGWRNVKSLAEDPDQPYNARLIGLVEAGLGWAAGIRFQNGSEEGIVIFISNSNSQLLSNTKIQSPRNEAYLISASDLIGSAWALRGPRHDIVEDHQVELNRTLRIVRIKLLALLRVGVSVEELAQPPQKVQQQQSSSSVTQQTGEPSVVSRTVQYSRKKVTTLISKSVYGGRSQAPPGKSFSEALFSAVGTLLTMLIVTQFGAHYLDEYGAALVAGPFGALATLHYGLTAAPASQPRNAICGQVVALTLGILFQRANMAKYLKMSLAPTLTVLITTKLGIIHPPAGASAVIFAGSSTLSWSNMGVFLVAYIIVIACSTFINNLNDKRQYPTYWGIGFLWDAIRPKEEKTKDN